MDARALIFRRLADHLRQRRNGMLKDWRLAVKADPALTTGNSLPRSQLHDHVPAALIAFEHRLVEAGPGETCLPEETIDAASAHGMHRWQQGYDLREVVRELGHLNRIMVVELDSFAALESCDGEAMAAARLAWASAYAAGIEQSTTQFYELQRVEAAGHVKDLETALVELTEVDRQRDSMWQQLAHDIRGNVGVVAAATRALAFNSASTDTKDKFTRMLERNVDSLRHLLDDVTSLTRLQAGAEQRQLAAFDVSKLLDDLCEGLQIMATQRKLYLHHEGPAAPFFVDGDAVKIRRVAQNLIINALKYTVQGGVDVTWGPCDDGDDKRWSLSVRDSGPGIHAGPGAMLASALQTATDVAHETNSWSDVTREEPVADSRPVQQVRGEGIGLSIVKRLAELLDATVEVESSPGVGTSFKIILPKSYEA